jgi:mannose-6-phosphate isomerase-like protein (cupin superfamily)
MERDRLGPYLAPSEGEHVLMRGGSVFIKSGKRSAHPLGMGTQQVLTGVGIPMHRHFAMDETFYVLEGKGTFILDDARYAIEKGGSLFIPRTCWHGFENPEQELLLLWIMAPQGPEGFFRELGTRPGMPPVQRSKDEINHIAGKYDTEFR